MGSKKHKRPKPDKRHKHEEYSMDRPSGLKLILKVGASNSTPEYGNDSPVCDMQAFAGYYANDVNEKYKKSKKKKKKKDREKKHKHHKEKRHRRKSDSNHEDVSFGEDNSQQLQETILNYAGITTDHSQAHRPLSKPLIPCNQEDIVSSPSASPTKILSEQMPILISSPGAASTPGGSSTPGLSNTPKPILEGSKTPSSSSESGREPRSCVLKLKQSKSPLMKLLDHLLRSLEKRDPHQFFAWPVTDDIAPGYSTIITKPMDFSTMRQKIEDNEYSNLQEFADDFKLMCENAMRYNHIETVYHKAAKRLLHVGTKLLQANNLIRSLKPLSGYMRELTVKELGFELTDESNHDHHNLDSADEGTSTGAEELTIAQTEEDIRRKIRKLENEPKTKFEPYVDDLTPEEILSQVQNAVRKTKKKLSANEHVYKMGFLRTNKDGTTSLRILLEEEQDAPEKVISIGAYVGKLAQGTGQLQGFREDRRNTAKIVKPLSYGAFSSFAPVFDSRFSNLSKEETDLVLNTYGNETGAEYAESIIEFTKNSSYASIIANRLLDVLTYGEHSKTMATLYDSQYQRYEQNEIEQSFPERKFSDEEEYQKYKNTKIDFVKLRSLADLGIDVSFLNDIEQEMRNFELHKRLHDHLQANLSLIEKLHTTQYERLSQPLPPHLTQVSAPGPEEHQLARQITANLEEMAKKLPPGAITDPRALRHAMGISNVGLPPPPQPKLVVPAILQEPCSVLSQDTNQISMDIEGNETNIGQTHSAVDLENELREFLENGSGLAGSHTDDNSIEQMLLN